MGSSPGPGSSRDSDLNATNALIRLTAASTQSGLAAMLAVKRSAGVAPEVNLRNSAQARKNASESTLALKPRADVTRSPKQGYQWPNKKDMCPPKNFKKKKEKKKESNLRLHVHL